MIRRRQLVASTAACVLGIPARGQLPGRTYRIAYFGFTATNSADDDRTVAAFVDRLAELGFVQGRNLIIEWRYAEGKNERYAEFAREMVQLRADVVVTGTSTAAHAVVEASRTMPVVTFGINDPLRTGLVASLAHPGGQVTGMSNFSGDLVAKRIELFKAAVPSMTKLALARCPRCGLLSGLSAASIKGALDRYREDAQSLGVSLFPLDINADTEFAAAVALLKNETPGGVLLMPTQINAKLRGEWAQAQASLRIPLMSDYRGSGCVLAYGPDYAAMFRRIAEFAARILNGAQAGELPMEQPTKLEFLVDLKAARTIGLSIPQSVLLRADDVRS